MSKTLRRIYTLIWKEVITEARGKEVVTLFTVTSISLATLIGIGVSGAMVEDRFVSRMFPTFLWISFFFSSVISMTRSHEAELEGKGYEALLLMGVSGAHQFIAKWIVTTLLLLVSFILSLIAISISLNQPIGDIGGDLSIVAIVTSLGIAPLMVLLGGIASTSKMRGVLLPLLVLPLMFPFFLAGAELTAEILISRALDLGSPWMSVLIGADTLFILLGINLYGISLVD